MPDPTPPIEQVIAPGEEQFDPSQLDDKGLQEFLGLTEPTPDNPDPTPDAGDGEGDAAADKALEQALAPEPAAKADVPAPADPAPQAEAEKPAAEPAAKQEKKPLYVAYGADGKPLADVPIKEVEITVAGKTKRVDLAALARMASSGGYNEQLQEEVKQAREVVARAQAIEAEAKRLAEEREAILRDPDYYLKRVEEYAQAQSPEARAERAEKALSEVQRREQMTQYQQYLNTQVETVMLPKINSILSEHPLVKEAEVQAQFETLIRPYVPHGGVIAPQHLPHVVEIIDRAIAPWAAQLHDARQAEAEANAAKDAAAKAAAAAEKARKDAEAKATKAKAETSRTIAPVGRVAAKPAPPKAPVRTANEGAERALDDALDFILNNPTG